MEEPMVLGCKLAADSNDQKETREHAAPTDTLLGVWKEFGESTSLHGLGRAINSRNIYLKLMWGVLVIAGFCGAGRNVYGIISTYLDYTVTTVVEMQSHQSMEFPAVTICNVNPVRLSKLAARTKNALIINSREDVSLHKLNWILHSHDEFVKRHEIDNYIFYKMSDMLLDCTFNWEPCHSSDFKTTDSYLYGKCFTFNAFLDQKPKKHDSPGNRNGLIVELNIREDDYIPLISTVGVKVLVHPRDEFPSPEDAGVMVGPGSVTSIGIQKVTMTRQPHPWGKCIHSEDVNDSTLNMFGDQSVYTTNVCEKTCYQRTVVDVCDCCDKYYPCSNNLRKLMNGTVSADGGICKENIRSTLACLEDRREEHAAGMLNCENFCFPSCKEVTYRTNYATGSWPADEFERIVIAKAVNPGMSNRRKSNTNNGNITSDFVSKNYLRLEVYFENFVEELILTNPAYDWNKLLSDIGGQLGLWLGLSILTVVEILELLHDIMGLIVRRILNFRYLPTKKDDMMDRQAVSSLDTRE